eukprot:g16156.t1
MEKILAPEPVLVRKPCEFPVTLDLKHRPPLGAEFEATQDRKALLVRVVSAGAFADWNRQHPLLAIQKGDRIVAVNHRSADAQASAGLTVNGLAWRRLMQRRCSRKFGWPVSFECSLGDLPHSGSCFDTQRIL